MAWCTPRPVPRPPQRPLLPSCTSSAWLTERWQSVQVRLDRRVPFVAHARVTLGVVRVYAVGQFRRREVLELIDEDHVLAGAGLLLNQGGDAHVVLVDG